MEKQKAKKRGILSKIFRIILKVVFIFIMLFFIISLSLVGLSQFEGFRHFVAGKVSDLINDNLQAQVSIQDLRFTGLLGLELEGVLMETAGDTLAYIPRLELNAEIEPLLNNKILVNRLVLHDPVIKLMRSAKDSLWNYEKIALPSDIDTTDTGPTDLQILVSNLNIKNANFIRYDSTLQYTKSRSLSYDHIVTKNFNLDIQADIDLFTNNFIAFIRHLSFYEINSALTVNNFSSKVELVPGHIAAANSTLSTPRSSVKFSAKMDNFDVFTDEGNSDVEKAVFSIDIDADTLDISDVYHFAEMPVAIEGKYIINGDIKGTLKEMKINELHLHGMTADINLSGKVFNLLGNEELRYDIQLANTNLDNKTPGKILPEIDLSSIPDIGKINIRSMDVVGNADTVSANFDIATSNAGSLSGKAGTRFGGTQTLIYSLNADVKNINLASIVGDKQLKSAFTGKIDFKGSGTVVEDMKFDFAVDLNKGSILGYEYSSFYTESNKIGNEINVDTLLLKLPRRNISDESTADLEKSGTITMSGNMNIANINDPDYSLNIFFKALDMEKLIDNDGMPNYLSGNINVEGSGIHPDSLDTEIHADITEAFFEDKAVMPFEIDAKVERLNQTDRAATVSSDFFNADIRGTFKFSELIASLSNQGLFLAEFLDNKINKVLALKNDTISDNENIQLDKIGRFPDIDCKIRAEIKDITPITTFLDSIDLNINTNIAMSLYSDENVSSLNIDSISIREFRFEKGDLEIESDPLFLDGRLLMSIQDSVPYFEDFSLNIENGQSIKINDNLITETNANLHYDGDNINFKFQSVLNNTFGMSSSMNAQLHGEKIRLTIDSTQFAYKDFYKKEILKPIIIIFDNKGFEIEQFDLAAEEDEVLKLSGGMEDNEFKDVKLVLRNYRLDELTTVIPPAQREQLPELKGILDSLTVTLDKSLQEPDIAVKASFDSISINNFMIGEIRSELYQNNNFIRGYLDIIKSDTQNVESKFLSVVLNYFPYKVAFDSTGFKFSDAYPMDMRVTADNLPLELVSPFVPSVDNLRGTADASFAFEGNMPDNMDVSGSINIDKATFVLENTNVSYQGAGKIKFADNRVNIEELRLRNVSTDNAGGNAKITGYVELEGFKPGYMDIKIDANNLLVLNEATRATMPDLYGTMIISTGNNPLNFYGTLSKPGLRGDINVNKADLKMKLNEEGASTSAKLEYIRVKDKAYLRISPEKDTTGRVISYAKDSIRQNSRKKDDIIEEETEGNIADLINYDLSIKLLSNVNLLMELPFGEMYAVIRTENRNTPILYVKNREENAAKISGSDIILDDKSTLKAIRVFKTSGKITFPTGSVQEPYLDITAVYNGSYSDESNKRHTFTVTIFLEGPPDNLKHRMTYSIDGRDATGDRSKIEDEALLILLNGSPPDAGGSSAAQSLSNAGISNVASQAFSGFLGRTGVIQSAEFDINSESFSESKVKVTGQVGDLNVSVGGSLQNIDESYEILVELPLSNYTDEEFWRNWVLQLSRSTHNNAIRTTEEKNWEFKVRFGGSW